MTEQEKREKVIKGLECCDEFVTCKANCPYRNDGCREMLSRDAIAIIRTMYTPREVRNVLIWYGQQDRQFKLGEIIRYDPVQVEAILTSGREAKTDV